MCGAGLIKAPEANGGVHPSASSGSLGGREDSGENGADAQQGQAGRGLQQMSEAEKAVSVWSQAPCIRVEALPETWQQGDMQLWSSGVDETMMLLLSLLLQGAYLSGRIAGRGQELRQGRY